MILEIDYGNTRLKWRLLSAETSNCIAKGAVMYLQELLLSLQRAGCSALVFCRASSVKTQADNKQLTVLIKANYGIEVVYAQSEKETLGVTNGYLDASKLGVDRWMVIIAGYLQVQRACVVIDCGTAITVDFIDSDGMHLGGCIAPGLKMLGAMLQDGTQLVIDLNIETNNQALMLGNTTQAAVTVGIKAMLSGFIQEQLRLAKIKLGPSFAVLCTGGDGALVSSVVDNAVVEDDLVFKGLAMACPYELKE